MLKLLLLLVICHVAHALPAGRLDALQADLALDRLEGMMERRLVFRWLLQGSTQSDKDGNEHNLGGGESQRPGILTEPGPDPLQQPDAFRDECQRLHDAALAAINAAWESRWGAVDRAIQAVEEESGAGPGADVNLVLTAPHADSNLQAIYDANPEYAAEKNARDEAIANVEAEVVDAYCEAHRADFSDDVRKLTQTTANALKEAGAVQAGAGDYVYVERADGAVFLTGPVTDGGCEYGHTTNFDAYARGTNSATWYIDDATKVVMAGWMSIDDAGTMVAWDAASGHFIPDADDVASSQLIKDRFCGHDQGDNPLDSTGKSPRKVKTSDDAFDRQAATDDAAADIAAACTPFTAPRTMRKCGKKKGFRFN